MRGYAKTGALDQVVTRYRRGERKDLPSMWTLVNVEMWLRSLSERGNATPAKEPAYQAA